MSIATTFALHKLLLDGQEPTVCQDLFMALSTQRVRSGAFLSSATHDEQIGHYQDLIWECWIHLDAQSKYAVLNSNAVIPHGGPALPQRPQTLADALSGLSVAPELAGLSPEEAKPLLIYRLYELCVEIWSYLPDTANLPVMAQADRDNYENTDDEIEVGFALAKHKDAPALMRDVLLVATAVFNPRQQAQFLADGPNMMGVRNQKSAAEAIVNTYLEAIETQDSETLLGYFLGCHAMLTESQRHTVQGSDAYARATAAITG